MTQSYDGVLIMDEPPRISDEELRLKAITVAIDNLDQFDDHVQPTDIADEIVHYVRTGKLKEPGIVDEMMEPERQSNLVDHARHELELLGEEPSTIDGYVKMIRIFADMGHSGGSASAFIPTLNLLLRFKNLRPLTDNPDEWQLVDGDSMWQNRRNGEAFSNDGGKHYYLLSDGGNARNPTPQYESMNYQGSYEETFAQFRHDD